MGYEDIVLDLKNKEIRGKYVKEIRLKEFEITTPEELEKYNPELAKWLREIKCKIFIWGWHGYGTCITEDKRILSVDFWRKEIIEELPKKEGIEELKMIARAKIIPPSEWMPEYAKIPVKIVGLEEVV